ncbi:unnamed protein product [Phaeothamnion confervicola]
MDGLKWTEVPRAAEVLHVRVPRLLALLGRGRFVDAALAIGNRSGISSPFFLLVEAEEMYYHMTYLEEPHLEDFELARMYSHAANALDRLQAAFEGDTATDTCIKATSSAAAAAGAVGGWQAAALRCDRRDSGSGSEGGSSGDEGSGGSDCGFQAGGAGSFGSRKGFGRRRSGSGGTGGKKKKRHGRGRGPLPASRLAQELRVATGAHDGANGSGNIGSGGAGECNAVVTAAKEPETSISLAGAAVEAAGGAKFAEIAANSANVAAAETTTAAASSLCVALSQLVAFTQIRIGLADLYRTLALGAPVCSYAAVADEAASVGRQASALLTHPWLAPVAAAVWAEVRALELAFAALRRLDACVLYESTVATLRLQRALKEWWDWVESDCGGRDGSSGAVSNCNSSGTVSNGNSGRRDGGSRAVYNGNSGGSGGSDSTNSGGGDGYVAGLVVDTRQVARTGPFPPGKRNGLLGVTGPLPSESAKVSAPQPPPLTPRPLLPHALRWLCEVRQVVCDRVPLHFSHAIETAQGVVAARALFACARTNFAKAIDDFLLRCCAHGCGCVALVVTVPAGATGGGSGGIGGIGGSSSGGGGVGGGGIAGQGTAAVGSAYATGLGYCFPSEPPLPSAMQRHQQQPRGRQEDGQQGLSFTGADEALQTPLPSPMAGLPPLGPGLLAASPLPQDGNGSFALLASPNSASFAVATGVTAAAVAAPAAASAAVAAAVGADDEPFQVESERFVFKLVRFPAAAAPDSAVKRGPRPQTRSDAPSTDTELSAVATAAVVAAAAVTPVATAAGGVAVSGTSPAVALPPRPARGPTGSLTGETSGSDPTHATATSFSAPSKAGAAAAGGGPLAAVAAAVQPLRLRLASSSTGRSREGSAAMEDFHAAEDWPDGSGSGADVADGDGMTSVSAAMGGSIGGVGGSGTPFLPLGGPTPDGRRASATPQHAWPPAFMRFSRRDAVLAASDLRTPGVSSASLAASDYHNVDGSGSGGGIGGIGGSGPLRRDASFATSRGSVASFASSSSTLVAAVIDSLAEAAAVAASGAGAPLWPLEHWRQVETLLSQLPPASHGTRSRAAPHVDSRRQSRASFSGPAGGAGGAGTAGGGGGSGGSGGGSGGGLQYSYHAARVSETLAVVAIVGEKRRQSDKGAVEFLEWLAAQLGDKPVLAALCPDKAVAAVAAADSAAAAAGDGKNGINGSVGSNGSTGGGDVLSRAAPHRQRAVLAC